MKKIILSLVTLVCILMVGCLQQKVEKSESLKEAYFQIGEKIVAKEEIDEKYIKKTLNEYEYEKGDEFKLENGNTDGSDYIQQPYIFTDGDETLTITYSNLNNKEKTEALYSAKDENGEISISISTPDIEKNENNPIYMCTLLRDNIKEHKEVLQKLNPNNTKYKDTYIEVADNVCSTNDIDIETIKKLIKVKPKIKEYSFDEDSSLGLNIIEYIFENDDEMFMVQYIKEKNKIWSIFYNDKNNGDINAIYDKSFVNKNDKLHVGIVAYVKNFEKQRELLDYVIK